MKKKILVVGMLGAASIAFSQQYLGLSNSNYSGVYGGVYNPAKLADKNIKLAVNFFTINALANNDFYRFNDFNTLLKSNNFAHAASYDAAQKRANLLLNGEVLLPSFQFTVNDRLGFGVTTRLRAFSQGKDVDANFLKVLTNNNGTFAYSSAERFGLKNNAISDIGISAGYKVIDNESVSLAIGAAAKMYTGIAYGNLALNGFYADNVAGSNDVMLNISNGTLSSNLNREQSYNNIINDAGDVLGLMFGNHSKVNTGRGFGGDIGAEFVLKDKTNKKPYAFKLGASVNDIGNIKYNNIQTFKISGYGIINPSELNLIDLNKTVDYLRSRGFAVVNETKGSMTVGLPTNLRGYVDYAISKKFFVSANALVNLADTQNTQPNSYYYNYAGIVPRFESKYFDVAVPLTYNFVSQDLKPGLAFRFGPLSIGSDDVKLLLTESKGANVYAGLRFVLFKNNKDTDKDGIIDKEDRCPTVAGPVENQGCPWPDTDNDGVLDKDDHCPDVAGPAETNGCPDTDGDGIIDRDDHCPTVAGAVENNGCPFPDTDGDGVLDKDDACPAIPGMREYNGCPKPQEVYKQEIDKALENILFNFNAATIRTESSSKLDNAAEIIKESRGKFLVVGHSDKKGNDNYNLKLSKERAAAVVVALEERGVDPDALKSIGVGEQDAKVSEKASDAERQKDRKVVVIPADSATWETLKKSDVVIGEAKKSKTTPKKATKKRK